ncbi:MAG: hypothetical protein M0Z92_12480, partial [Actinomycetota bacterium]|nr:hypothetical protein [Actinomycetota bacterium]
TSASSPPPSTWRGSALSACAQHPVDGSWLGPEGPLRGQERLPSTFLAPSDPSLSILRYFGNTGS